MLMAGLEQMLGMSLSYMMIKVIYLKVCNLYHSPFPNHVHIMQCHGLDQLMPPHWGLDVYSAWSHTEREEVCCRLCVGNVPYLQIHLNTNLSFAKRRRILLLFIVVWKVIYASLEDVDPKQKLLHINVFWFSSLQE